MTSEIDDWTGKIHQGDAIEVMEEMPEKSVDCVIFSPPYWGLRDYGEDAERIWNDDENCNHEWGKIHQKPRGGLNTEENPPDVGGNRHTQETRLRGEGIDSNYCRKCNAWKGQFGLEPTPDLYAEHLREVGESVYRVLKDDGSWWLNIGDTYAGGGGIDGVPDDWDSISTVNRDKYPDNPPAKQTGYPDKCKLLIPHRVAISLIDDGWICRNDAVWHKINTMPESVVDRFTTTFEFFFFFTKSQKYYFDMESVKQPNGAQPRDVFRTIVANNPKAHFATFPEELIKIPIKASCPPDGVVLDPFMGSGTTAVVAEKLKRDWIGIDLNPEYVDMSWDRIETETDFNVNPITDW